MCQGHCLSCQSVVPPRLLGVLSSCGIGQTWIPVSFSAILVKDREGGQLTGLSRPGQPSRQPDAKSSATLVAPFTTPGPGPAGNEAGPQWENPGRRPGAGGLTVQPDATARPHHPRRGTCPQGAAPLSPLRLDSDNSLAVAPLRAPPRCPARTSWEAATRMRAPLTRDSDAGLTQTAAGRGPEPQFPGGTSSSTLPNW